MSKITIPQVGESYVGDNPAIVKCARVTIGVSSGAPDVVAEATGVFPLFTVPAGCLVSEVKGRVLEAFTASVDINVGDSDDVDGLLAEAVLASTTYSSDTRNLLRRNVSGYVDSTGADGGRLYDAAQDINATITAATPAVGKAEFFIFYTQAGLI